MLSSSAMIFVNLPVSTVVLFVRVNAPSARVTGLDGYDLAPIFQRTLDVEILLVVHVLERPTVAGVLNPPLHGKVRIACRAGRGVNEPSDCHSSEW